MRTLIKLRLRLKDELGAVTEENAFLALLMIVLLGVLALIFKSEFFIGLMQGFLKTLVEFVVERISAVFGG